MADQFLPYKYEDPSADPSTHIKARHTSARQAVRHRERRGHWNMLAMHVVGAKLVSFGIGEYICHFSVAVTKPHELPNFQKEEFIGLQCQRRRNDIRRPEQGAKKAHLQL